MTTILVVEDNNDLREAIAEALTDVGFDVLQAPDGESGAALALKEHPDLTLLDVMMPKLNGHEALKKIRNDVWGIKAKVIFLTSLSDAENVVQAVENGSEDFIVKPHVTLKEIISRVRVALSK